MGRISISSATSRFSTVRAFGASSTWGRAFAVAYRLFFAGLLSGIAALTLGAGPALASKTHLFDSTTSAGFGAIPGALGVAIDQSTGDIYVSELSGSSVRKFNAAGEPVASFGAGSGEISGFGAGPWQLAVDQTSHDFYVATQGDNAVYKFDSSGSLVSSFGTSGQVSVRSPIGVGVDPTNGDLYVANYEKGKINVFTSAGALITKFSTDQVSAPVGVAIDAGGHVYIAGGGYGGSEVLERFAESGTPEGVVETGAFHGVTVDPANEDVYASQSGELDQYSPGGESLISAFGAGDLEDAWGVAVNETSSEVYTGAYSSSNVDAFGPLVILADVVTESPAEGGVGHTTATLTGKIDPAGGPPVTECDIEYGTDTNYSNGRVPCQTATPITVPTTVSAKLTGLTPLTTYHYRFVAKNENETSYGDDQTLEPPAVLGIDTVPATNVAASEATLNGTLQVDPEGGETQYSFEWGPTEAYGHQTVDASVSEDGIQNVSTALSGLTSYTFYHYRLVATNAFGTEYGPDRTFYTLPPSLPSIGATGASNVGPERATLEAKVNPGSGATVVRFEYGPNLPYTSKTMFGESIGEDATDHLVSVQVAGLTPGTAYHFRVRAVNFDGTVESSDQTFDTPNPPTGSTVLSNLAPTITPGTPAVPRKLEPKKCPHNSVRKHGKCVRKHRHKARHRERGPGHA